MTNRFRINFTRVFVKGLLKGLTHQDSLPFISKVAARSWLRCVTRHSKAGRLNYLDHRRIDFSEE
jgi:hypothetical protein